MALRNETTFERDFVLRRGDSLDLIEGRLGERQHSVLESVVHKKPATVSSASTFTNSRSSNTKYRQCKP